MLLPLTAAFHLTNANYHSIAVSYANAIEIHGRSILKTNGLSICIEFMYRVYRVDRHFVHKLFPRAYY